MNMDIDAEEAAKRVQVRFVTKLNPPFKAPPTSIAIPSNLTRLGLSAVVNNLLKAGDDDWKPEPFDFLIGGELIRMSLEEFLLAKKISAEKILDIEYIKAVAPRKEEEPSLHDDWVSAVDGSNSKFIVIGCYDGVGRLWKEAGSCTHVLKGHTSAVTSVCVIKPKGAVNGGDELVATASKDRTVRFWKIDADEILEQPKRIRAYKILRGHNASVQSIAAQPSGEMVCSGSWDCTINLWQANDSDAVSETVSIKKRKKGKKEEKDDDPQTEGEAVSTLIGHTQCVSSVVWPKNDTIYSSSWDRSIRSWDVETGKDIVNMFSGKAINCLDVGGESSALIAAGGSDPILRIWDPRKPDSLAPIFQFSSHSSWISACKWHDKSWFHLVSASYDGKVMLWDLRTAWPLTIIDSHKDKVLCTAWWRGDSIISGGADSKLCISSELSLQ
ncbi:PREDICTED: ribosome biogenesis protein WDR12 homolog isoform X1 [Ipomoea nil]|uniref:ribosome biogenesis protein WDR12 homolog isoform X1 n=1 Tax=Ipomoea nil TaxID=35883 RepID=UPI000901FFAE|nr:PREDICTED: ribosome biogenesis protein WDR12 homolog isoform X1 [Ipomoea nil]